MPTLARQNKPHAEAVNSAILTKQQAAEYLQTTPRYIERMVSSGRLNALKPTGRLWRVRRRELDRFLDAAVEKTEISPIGAQTLTKAEITTGYHHPQTSISDASFSTNGEIVESASQADGSIDTAGEAVAP
jgi:excisionase family DNA binding protein